MITIQPYLHYQEKEILPLYQAVGWSNYTKDPSMLQRAYVHSLCTLGAYHKDQLVGIIRVVGDEASILYIQDLIVLPFYQRKGIGTKLLKDILKRYPKIYQIVLLTDQTEKTKQFYQSLGFSPVDQLECRSFIYTGTH
ncbi:GNAT family N-acetyltransferase [Streptococcus pneumoniae]